MENEKPSLWNKPASEITVKESLILTGVITAATIAVPVVIVVVSSITDKINELRRNRKKTKLTSVKETE